ncbi:MAG: tRNA pseudouridine(55) synthase TruB [Polyangiaceae bacterium]
MAEKLSGALIVDKPRGPTSHDVVARVRRALHERRVGHAGTLDPMATGVLVVLVGEGTKLAPYLTAADKRYTARVTFGAATATLDAEGEVVARAEIPSEIASEIDALAADLAAPAARIAAALDAERARAEQIPPAYSAIQIDGERSHDLARAGKAIDLPPRAISVRSIDVLGAAAEDRSAPAIDLDLLVSKGYYVRSFARDLGAHLGVPAHLSQLRRTASGAFTAAEALPLDSPPDALRGAILPIATAVRRALPVATLSLEGVVRARQGKRLGPGDFEACPPLEGPAAWLDPSGDLIAIGEAQPDAFIVLRGFTSS